MLLVGPSHRNPRHVMVLAMELTSDPCETSTSLLRTLTSLTAQAGTVSSDNDKLWVLLRLPNPPGITSVVDKLILRPTQSSLLLLAPCDVLTVGLRTRGNGQTVAEVVLSRNDGWCCVGPRLNRG